MFMGGIGHALSNCLLIYGIGFDPPPPPLNPPPLGGGTLAQKA